MRRHPPFSLLLARSPLLLSSVMLATLRTGSADPRCSLSRLLSWFSRLKLRLVTCSRFRSRSSLRSSRLSNRSPLRLERSKLSLRSRLELFLQDGGEAVCHVYEKWIKKHSDGKSGLCLCFFCKIKVTELALNILSPLTSEELVCRSPLMRTKAAVRLRTCSECWWPDDRLHLSLRVKMQDVKLQFETLP